jgi:hypothetical protein
VWLFVTSSSEEEDANACAALLRLILLFIAITPINENATMMRQILKW